MNIQRFLPIRFHPLTAALLLLFGSQAGAQDFNGIARHDDGLQHELNPTGAGPFVINTIGLSNGSTLTLGPKTFTLESSFDNTTHQHFSNVFLRTGATLLLNGSHFDSATHNGSVYLQGTIDRPVTLLVENGAVAQLELLHYSDFVANTPAGSATVIVDGRGSRLTSRALDLSGPDGSIARLIARNLAQVEMSGEGGIVILSASSNTLTVQSGATFNTPSLNIAERSRSTITVEGVGSTLTVGQALTVSAAAGENHLIIRDGGRVSLNTLDSAPGPFSIRGNTSVIVQGDGSQLQLARNHIELGGGGLLAIGGPINQAAAAPGNIALPLGSNRIVFSEPVGEGIQAPTLLFNHSSTAETPYHFTPSLSGPGRVLQRHGYTILSGDNSGFAGNITISEGVLEARNSMSDRSTIDVSAGKLHLMPHTGPVQFGAIRVAQEAILQATHNEHGATTADTLNLAPGSTLKLSLRNPDSPPISVTREAVISDANLRLGLQQAPDLNRPYTLLVAGTSITGRFAPGHTLENDSTADIDLGLAFLTATLQYSDTSVQAQFARRMINPIQPVDPDPPINNGQPDEIDQAVGGAQPDANARPDGGPQPGVDTQPVVVDPPMNPGRPIQFADRAASANQQATAQALESLPKGTPLYNYVLTLPQDAPPSTFNALSGDSHLATVQALQTSAVTQVSAVPLQRLNQLNAARRTGVLVASSSNYIPESARPFDPSNSVWAQATGNWQTHKTHGADPGFRAHTGGIFAGADHQFGEKGVTLGAALGFTNTHFSVKQRDTSTKINNYSLTLYGSKTFALPTGNLNTLFGASYTWHELRTQRSLYSIGLPQTLRARHGAYTTQLFAEVGHEFMLDSRSSLEPFGGLLLSHLRTKAIAESGGDAALNSRGSHQSTLTSTLGVRGHMSLDKAQLRASLGWRHAMDNVSTKSRFAFNGGESFSIGRQSSGRNSLAVEAGADIMMSRSSKLSLTYAGDFANHGQQHSVIAEARWRF